jgi:hypothetical protein
MSRLMFPLLLAALCFTAAFLAARPAPGGERDSFLDERPGIGEPLRFRDERGGAFRPRSLILRGAEGALAARLPSGARSAWSEDRIDLSSAPLVGPLFRETLDVATVRQGPLVGPVYRVGDTLVVDATIAPSELADRQVAFSTNLPRVGAVSYGLGPLDWTPAAAPAPTGAPIGSAHLVGNALVLASQGGEPAWPSIEAMFRDLF